MRICIYDDRRAADLGPLTRTRPASDLLCGLTTLAEKQAAFFKADRVGYLVRPELAALLKARDPAAPVNDPAWLRAAPAVGVVAGEWDATRKRRVARDLITPYAKLLQASWKSRGGSR